MWRSIFAGVLALVALEAVVSSGAAAGRFGGLITGISTAAKDLLDPAVPGIPDLSDQ